MIKYVVTRGFGNGTFHGTINLIALRGYSPDRTSNPQFPWDSEDGVSSSFAEAAAVTDSWSKASGIEDSWSEEAAVTDSSSEEAAVTDTWSEESNL